MDHARSSVDSDGVLTQGAFGTASRDHPKLLGPIQSRYVFHPYQCFKVPCLAASVGTTAERKNRANGDVALDLRLFFEHVANRLGTKTELLRTRPVMGKTPCLQGQEWFCVVTDSQLKVA